MTMLEPAERLGRRIRLAGAPGPTDAARSTMPGRILAGFEIRSTACVARCRDVIEAGTVGAADASANNVGAAGASANNVRGRLGVVKLPANCCSG